MSSTANQPPLELSTKRLILRAATQEITSHELAFLNHPNNEDARSAFEQSVGAQVMSWPPLYNDATTCAYFVQKLTEKPNTYGWWAWYIQLARQQDSPLLIGTAGFHGPPDRDGSVEIGYSVLQEYQRQGIAPETVQALTAWAFSHNQVAKVIITTLDLPEFVPSGKVAQKCGYRYSGTKPSDEGTLLVYELKRQEYRGS